MGFWGNGLYENDVALDIKESYILLLKNGNDSREATDELLKTHVDFLEDEDDALFFWLALADTQWKRGVLEERVKKKALSHIDCIINGKCDGVTSLNLKKLKDKLLSPQPSEKKLSHPRSYRCEWKLGDTYAYPLICDYAKEKGLLGEYVIFHKIAEMRFHPEHIIPVVWAKITKNGKLPVNKDELNNLDFIQTSVTLYKDRFPPLNFSNPLEEQIIKRTELKFTTDEFGHLPQFRLALINTSKRIIPKSLIYLGKFQSITPPRAEFVPYYDESIPMALWKYFDKMIIDAYLAFNCRQSPLYSNNKK